MIWQELLKISYDGIKGDYVYARDAAVLFENLLAEEKSKWIESARKEIEDKKTQQEEMLRESQLNRPYSFDEQSFEVGRRHEHYKTIIWTLGKVLDLPSLTHQDT